MYFKLKSLFMFRLVWLLVILCLSMATMPSSGYCTTYYVENDGNDSNAGTSDELAWKTIGKVNSFDLADGDVVLFKRGSVFFDTTLGSPDANNITFADYGLGAKPTLDGDRICPIKIRPTASIRNLTIRNIDISGQDWSVSKSPNISISNVEGVYISGVFGDGHRGGNESNGKNAISIVSCMGDVVIENCELYNWGPTDLLLSGEDFMGIVVFYHTSGSYNIRNNIIHDIGADGIQLYESFASGVVTGNTIYNCGEQGIDIKGTSNVQVVDNEFYRTNDFKGEGGDGAGGVPCHINVHEGKTPQSENVKIENNFIHDGDGAGIIIGRVREVSIKTNRFMSLATSIFIGNPSNNVDITGNIIVDSLHRTFSEHEYEGGGIYENNAGEGVRIYNNTLANVNGNCTSLVTLACSNGTEIYQNIIFNTVNDGSDVVGVTRIKCGTTPVFSENCIYVDGGSERVIYDNEVYSNNDVVRWNAIAGKDIFSDPYFVNSVDQNFTLRNDTPCKTGDVFWGALSPEVVAPINLRVK